MSGTKEGSKKAVETIIKKHGADFFANIGRMGGKKGHTGGFFNDPERAALAGSIGGKRSKRGPARKKNAQ